MCWQWITLLISCNITWVFTSRHRESLVIDWRPQMCKFITKSITLRMTHWILAPCKWRNAFGTVFDSYSTVLRIRAPWKAPPHLQECKATKIFCYQTILTTIVCSILLHVIKLHIHMNTKKAPPTTKGTAWIIHFLWFLFFSSKLALKTYL